MRRYLPTRLAIASAALIVLPPAFADYAANYPQFIDPVTAQVAPGTLTWGNNSNGQVVGTTTLDNISEFSFVYDSAAGSFQRLPPAPALPAGTPLILASGINDAGSIVGRAVLAPGQDVRGFVWDGVNYIIFSYPGAPLTEARTISNPSAAHPMGLVVGMATFPDLLGITEEGRIGFVYDPSSGVFTRINTPNSLDTRLHGINDAGEIVGSVRFSASNHPDVSEAGVWAVRFTPAVPSDAALGGALSYFRINGLRTAARGINNYGVIAAQVTEVSGRSVVYVGDSSGFELVALPAKAEGDPCEPFAFPEGVNNSGQVTALYTSSKCIYSGLVISKVVPVTETTTAGAYVFDTAVAAGTPTFIDPPVASGYDYTIGKQDPLFATVRLPLGIGNNQYVLVAGNQSFDVRAGQLFDFTTKVAKKGVTGFRVACIDPAAALDVANPLAFPTELTFMAAGRFTGTQKPLAKSSGNNASETQSECRGRLLE